MSPLLERLTQTIVPPLARTWIRLLAITMRVERENAHHLDDAKREHGAYILAFWHSRFLMMPWGYPHGRIVVLVSQHRDAELLVRTLHPMGFAFARGSTTRGGTTLVREVLRRFADGYDVGVAPDGPRGPRRRVQPGVIAIARMTGMPICPVAFSAAPARRLGSWDRTLIPRLFSRGRFVYGPPRRVPRDATAAEEERHRLELEVELDRLTDAADTATGLGPEEPRP